MYSVVSRWSQTLKHSDIEVCDYIAWKKNDSYEIACVLADTVMDEERLPIFVWTLKIVKMSKRVGMGIRLSDKAKRLDFKFSTDLQHDKTHSNGHYAITS
jgi:hypothetical protein